MKTVLFAIVARKKPSFRFKQRCKVNTFFDKNQVFYKKFARPPIMAKKFATIIAKNVAN